MRSCRARDADLAHAADDDALGLGLADVLVQPQRLDELIADRVHRAHRRHRLLRDQRDLAAADRPHLVAVGVEGGEIDHLGAGVGPVLPAPATAPLPAEQDLAADDLPRLLDDAQHGFDR